MYLPPVHPIGRSFRKGRNNSLVAGPDDPGSPWAIGSADGGHTAIEPGLGTIGDFEAFCVEARRLGLEIALDLAWQCSPDHPWVREHPEWFRHRPDGTIKYAENPPKKYQDIYPFDFETEHWRELWQALLDVTVFWVEHGVKIFRVDNPHTKTFGFWEWMIDRVHQQHADVIFLSEAFTRPRLMRYLAKAGFTQSYTYFTWRNSKAEISDYFTELTESESREYLRPNLFVNTPDILHAYLQHGGRSAFEARLLLAATLGASYGIYSGFELAENRPAAPGSEEYADSEKYQYRRRNWDRPGNINELVWRVNRIRHQHPALQVDRTLRFHATDNPELIAYSKVSADGGESLLMVVNLDPHHMQHGHVEVPVDRDAFVVDDDKAVREATADLLASVGLRAMTFRTAQEFLARPRPEAPGCLVLDVRLPRLSGLDLQRELARSPVPIPIIFITAHGDVPMSVQAMKAGAVEFLTKPFRDQQLLEAIEKAIERDRGDRQRRKELTELRNRFESLTPREHDVMARVVAGLLNKQVKSIPTVQTQIFVPAVANHVPHLLISYDTNRVKITGAEVMQKMRADSLPDLVRMAERLGSSARGD